MPILELQQRLRELGRIRIGAKVATKNGKQRPSKLEAFRFTSPSLDLVTAVADLYGGAPQPWSGGEGEQFEVFSEATAIDIALAPMQVLDQWNELWSGGGCQRRCDGRTEILKMQPCRCPADPVERQELAANGEACKPTTRLWVILPQVPGIGVWRLETHGYYAATELSGVAHLLAAATARGQALPATLRLEQRQRKVPGKPIRKFGVPAIDVAAPIGQVLESIGAVALPGVDAPALEPGRRGTQRVPIPDGAPALPGDPSFRALGSGAAEHGPAHPPPADPRGRAKDDAPPIPSAPSAAAEQPPLEPPDDEPAEVINEAQVTKAVVTCKEAGLEDEGRHALVTIVTGGRTESSKELTKPELDQLLVICELMVAGHVGLSADGAQLLRQDNGEPMKLPLGVNATRKWLAQHQEAAS